MIAVFSFLSILACVLFIDGVQAHGYVANVTIGGKVYPGWDPNIDP